MNISNGEAILGDNAFEWEPYTWVQSQRFFDACLTSAS
jgi:hypothetical protein